VAQWEQTLYKYRMHLYWSEPDQAWIVDIPDLPGAMADGETPEAAVAMAQKVIALWIETARTWAANPRTTSGTSGSLVALVSLKTIPIRS